MLLPVRPPLALRKLFHQCHWNIPNEENKIFLTFDDGPTPQGLPIILETLSRYNIKATFFCVGENMAKFPSLASEMIEEGHVLGNHTYNHLNGWKTPNYSYYRNIQKCSDNIKSCLFRPPYGKITRSQARHISSKYKIILWDVLSYDYKKSVGYRQCVRNVVKSTRSGSIIVFHDNLKSENRLRDALPGSIEHLLRKGFIFDTIK